MTQINSAGGPGLSIRELQSGLPVKRVHEITKADGLDEIFVHGNDGKDYVAYAPKIENIDKHRVGDDITLTSAEGKQITGKVSFVDDEATSALEGAAKPFKDASTWIAGAGAGAGGAALGVGANMWAGMAAAFSGGMALTVGTAVAIGAGVGIAAAGVGVAALGAFNAASKQTDSTTIDSLSKPLP